MSTLTRNINGKHHLDWMVILTIALGLFIGGTGVNLVQLSIDYGTQWWINHKLLEMQQEDIRDYEKNHPGSHPETKDFHVDRDGKVVPNDGNI